MTKLLVVDDENSHLPVLPMGARSDGRRGFSAAKHHFGRMEEVLKFGSTGRCGPRPATSPTVPEWTCSCESAKPTLGGRWFSFTAHGDDGHRNRGDEARAPSTI